MLRITLGGQGMADFPAGQVGGYVKLRLGTDPQTGKPIVRTYTIRNQREGEIDIDFALHASTDGDEGPATNWAKSARAGDMIEVGGPGPAKPLPEGADFYLVAGDMTALPAIGANLERLDRDAKGAAYIEIISEADCQVIDHPAGVKLHWIVNPRPGRSESPLSANVQGCEWPLGEVYGWSACEFSSMQALRSYLRDERGLTPKQLYISSYWKSGLTEDAHKLAKREDARVA